MAIRQQRQTRRQQQQDSRPIAPPHAGKQGDQHARAAEFLQRAEDRVIALIRSRLPGMLTYGHFGTLTIDLMVKDGEPKVLEGGDIEREHFDW